MNVISLSTIVIIIIIEKCMKRKRKTTAHTHTQKKVQPTNRSVIRWNKFIISDKFLIILTDVSDVLMCCCFCYFTFILTYFHCNWNTVHSTVRHIAVCCILLSFFFCFYFSKKKTKKNNTFPHNILHWVEKQKESILLFITYLMH